MQAFNRPQFNECVEVLLRDSDALVLAARHRDGDSRKLTNSDQFANLVVTALKQFCEVVDRVILGHKKTFH